MPYWFWFLIGGYCAGHIHAYFHVRGVVRRYRTMMDEAIRRKDEAIVVLEDAKKTKTEWDRLVSDLKTEHAERMRYRG